MEFEDEHDEEQEEEEDDEDDIIIPPPAIPPSYVDSVIMNSAPHRVNPVSHQPSPEIRRSSSIPVRYRECLKNHAVGIGGHAVDGCGEFMPAGEDGTLDALKCAACNCHRNFHRKEAASASSDSVTPLRGPGERTSNNNSLSPGPLSSPGFNAAAFAAASAAANAAAGAGGGVAFPQHQFSAYYRTPAPHPHLAGYLNMSSHPHPQHRPAIPALPSSNTSGGTHSGEMGDDMSHPSSSGGGGGGGSGMIIMSSGGTSNNKKRHRTKFSQEQKDQMLGFAEKLGWRIQKHDEAAVQQFCAETQVKRQVLKVWMHNNKHTIGKKLP